MRNRFVQRGVRRSALEDGDHLVAPSLQRLLELLEKLALGADVKGMPRASAAPKARDQDKRISLQRREIPLPHGAFSERTYPTPRIVWISLVRDVRRPSPRR